MLFALLNQQEKKLIHHSFGEYIVPFIGTTPSTLSALDYVNESSDKGDY